MSDGIRTKTARRGMLSRLAREESGAVATWFAILLVPMLGFTFGAIKYAQLAEHRTGMLDAMDAAGLGLARQLDLRDLDDCVIGSADPDDPNDVNGPIRAELERYAREFFKENYPEYSQLYADKDLTTPLNLDNHMVFDMTCAYISVETLAYVDMGGLLGRYFDVGAIPLNLATEISLPGAGRVEIALVLDVTGSMCYAATSNASSSCVSAPDRRIDKLRTAVEGMLNDPNMYGTAADAENSFVRMSVVPFNSMVNIGANYSGTASDGSSTDSVDDWMDFGATALYHGANFLHAEQSGAVGPDTKPLISVSDRKVNHFELFRSVDAGNGGATWKGCVEARPFPLDEMPFTPGENPAQSEYDAAWTTPSFVTAGTNQIAKDAWSSMRAESSLPYAARTAANTLFVPYFAPDEPDCRRDKSGGGYIDDCVFDVPSTDPYTTYNNGVKSWWGTSRNYPEHLFWSTEHRGFPRGSYSNRGFIRDRTFINPAYKADELDRYRYRNLVLDWNLQGYEINDDHSLRRYCYQSTMPYVENTVLVSLHAKQGITDCEYDEFRLRQAYVGVRSQLAGGAITDKVYYGKYENMADTWWNPTNDDPGEHAVAGIGPNNGCGGPIQPLTSKKAEVKAVLDKLTPSGSTNTAVGLSWGWRTLTHTAPFVEGANPNTPSGGRWRKYVVLMTDGENTFSTSNTHNLSRFSIYGYASEDRLGTGRYGYDEEFDAKTIRMCHRMREEGIKVFTIGFAVDDGDGDDTTMSRPEAMLRACAVDEDGYKDADDGEALATAFKAITEQIVELHVSG